MLHMLLYIPVEEASPRLLLARGAHTSRWVASADPRGKYAVEPCDWPRTMAGFAGLTLQPSPTMGAIANCPYYAEQARKAQAQTEPIVV